MKREALLVTCVGINHRTAPVEEREKVAFSAEELPDALTRLYGELGGAVLLSTCNRTELYTTTRGDVADMERLGDALAGRQAGPQPDQHRPLRCFRKLRRRRPGQADRRVSGGEDGAGHQRRLHR